jgi:H+/Cl- antiporter ClcA
MCAAFMAAAVVGVTKTLVGSTLVVTEMGGMRLLPTTMIAATIAFLLTSRVGLIETQRERAPLDEEI